MLTIHFGFHKHFGKNKSEQTTFNKIYYNNNLQGKGQAALAINNNLLLYSTKPLSIAATIK